MVVSGCCATPSGLDLVWKAHELHVLMLLLFSHSPRYGFPQERRKRQQLSVRGQSRVGAEPETALRPRLCPTPGPSPASLEAWITLNTNLCKEVTPAISAVGRMGTHPGPASQVFPLDFCFALSRQSCVKDKAGTVVELLDPLVTGCCQKGLAQGCSHCPGLWGE